MNQKRKFMPGDRLLKIDEVSDLASLSRSTIYLLISKGTFPKPIKIGSHSVAWIEAEILDYINRKMEERDSVA